MAAQRGPHRDGEIVQRSAVRHVCADGAARLLVPLFQRRYCWVAEHWARLWRDVALGTASALAPHAIGRVTIARDRKAVLVVDGQQRCTTMMLLLAAVRDVRVLRRRGGRRATRRRRRRDPAPPAEAPR